MEVERKPIRSFKDLEVYQRGYRSSIDVCKKIVPNLPKEERFDLSDQLRRSSKAVPRLIAEGYGKRHQVRGFQKYLDDAIAEANETQVGLCHVKDLYGGRVGGGLCEKLIDEYDIMARQLYRLRESWQNFKSTSKTISTSKPASKPKPTNQSGFTLIELLVTVGLFALLAALAGFILINAQATPRFETSQNQLIATIRQAQTLAMGGDKADQSTAQSFGIHFESDSYTLFKGMTYSESDDYNLTTAFSGVALSTIDVPSGNIVFQKISGEVLDWDSDHNSVVLSDDEGNSVTLTINIIGVVEY